MLNVTDVWVDSFEELPPRSRLISLKPRGHGTIWQEALTSLFVRIARAHTCAPLTLLNKEVLPNTDVQHTKSSSSFVSLHIKTMNGVGKYAGEFVARLEELTMQRELQRCTFLAWADILDPRGCGLLHMHPHWCRECFDEWRQNGVEPYFPLIWMAAPVVICPKHGTLLSESCSSCGRHQPFIPKHAYLDHCSHCGFWLGPKSDQLSTFPSAGAEFMRYQVKVVGEMIATMPPAGMIGTISDFQRQIRGTAEACFSDSITRFEKELGFRKKSMRNWLKNDTRPSLPLLMTMCHRLGSTLLEFLKGGAPEGFIAGKRTFGEPAIYEKHRVTKAQLDKIRNTLAAIISSGVAERAMKTVAAELGCPYTYLNYWFRDECRAISSLHRDYRRAEARKKREAQISQTKSVVYSLYQQRVKVTRRVIENHLKAHGILLSRPEIRTAVKEAQADFLRPVSKTG